MGVVGLILISSFSFLPVARGAVGTKALVREVEADAGAEYARLIAHRREIEAGAYDETLRLCRGYRVVRGFAAAGSAVEWRAWGRIFKEGLDQSFSLIDGTKADFVAANNVRIWQMDSWLRSVHTLYLINSEGFRRAAAECLADADPREARWFALAIVNADVAGSVTSTVASGAGFVRVWALAKQSTRWAWRPAGRVVDVLRARLGRPLVAGAAALGPVAAAVIFNHLEDIHLGVRDAENFLSHLDDEQRQLKKIRRKLLMAGAVRRLGAGLDRQDLGEFDAWVKANVTAEDRARAHEDYDRIRSGAAPEPGDRQYQSVLKAILPVLDQLELPG